MGLKYPKLVYTNQIVLNSLLQGPALAGKYLLIFYRVKARGSSNTIRVPKYKNKEREVFKKKRKEKRIKEKTSPIAIIFIPTLKTAYYYQLRIFALSKGQQS